MRDSNDISTNGRHSIKNDGRDGKSHYGDGGEEQRRYHDPDWLKKQYDEKELTQAEIGEKCGVSASTISKWMRRHGIETRASKSTGVHTYWGRKWQVTWLDGHTFQLHQLIALQNHSVSEVFDEDTVVHHETGCPVDNRADSLDIITRGEHTILHRCGVFIHENCEPKLVLPTDLMNDNESAVEAVA